MYQVAFLIYWILAGYCLGKTMGERKIAKERRLLRDLPGKCPRCGGEINHIPAGISRRTGNHYQEFWACSTPGCSFTINKWGGIYQCNWIKREKIKGRKTPIRNDISNGVNKREEVQDTDEIDVSQIPF